MTWMLVLSIFLAQDPAAPAPAATAPAAAEVPSVTKRMAFEGVVGFKGKPIGTTILLDIDADNKVTGWIQRNDFYPVDAGRAELPDKISFTSGGNEYVINLRTGRINYSGLDGNGNQRVEKMMRIEGRVYQVTEEALGERKIVLQMDGRQREYTVTQPAVWKRAGTPIDRFSRIEEVLGKTIHVWMAPIGGTHYLAVIEEPEGVDLQKKAPKEKKEKKK